MTATSVSSTIARTCSTVSIMLLRGRPMAMTPTTWLSLLVMSMVMTRQVRLGRLESTVRIMASPSAVVAFSRDRPVTRGTPKVSAVSGLMVCPLSPLR